MTYHRDSYLNDYVEPCFLGYQLLGDSQFLRFAEKILHQERKKKNGTGYLGHCVSGQKVGDLLRRIKREEYPTTRKVIILIGTNDLLQQTKIETMQDNLKNLLEELLLRGVSKMVLLTCPPVPRLVREEEHWDRLKAYNEYIQVLAKKFKGNVEVIDAYSKFVKPRRRSHSSASSIRSSLSSSAQRLSSSSLNLSTQRLSSSSLNLSTQRLSSSSLNSSTQRLSSTSLIFPHDISSGEPPKYKTNLRISVGSKRKVYRLEDEDSSSGSSHSSSECYHPKKKLHRSITEDDHNDRFIDDDSFSELCGKAEEIRMDLFEEYFSLSTKKVDKIHFNYHGLRIIKHLITSKLSD